MVVEVIDGHICFAPSRFVGYINNTREKHDENHGDGTDTDNRIKQYYQKVADERLDALMQAELSKYEEASANKKYWIPNGMTIEDILAHSNINSRRYWVFAPGESCDHWEECKSNGLMLPGRRHSCPRSERQMDKGRGDRFFPPDQFPGHTESLAETCRGKLRCLLLEYSCGNEGPRRNGGVLGERICFG